MNLSTILHNVSLNRLIRFLVNEAGIQNVMQCFTDQELLDELELRHLANSKSDDEHPVLTEDGALESTEYYKVEK